MISIVATVAMVAVGCDLIPARRRIDPEYYPIRQPPRSVAERPPLPESRHSPQPSLARRHAQPQLPKLQRVEPEEVLGPPPPTPMLDAALQRAEAVRNAALDGFDQAPDPRATPPPDLGRIEYIIDPNRLKIETSEEQPAEARRSKPAESVSERAPEAADAEPSSEPEAPQADTEPDRRSAPTEAAAASDRWRDGLTELLDLSSEAASEGGETAEVWAARRRVLDWLSEAEAEPEVDDVTLWRTVLTMLSEDGDPAVTNAFTPEGLDLVQSVADVEVDPERKRKSLKLNDLRLCREVSGFGVFDELDPEAIAPGQDLIIYCELAGVTYEPVEEGSRSRLLTELELTATADDTTVWSEFRRTEDRSRKPRRDYYVGYLIRLPESMPEGRYRIRVSQRDRLSGGVATGSIDFRVSAGASGEAP